jgi:hypothetical protein
MKVIFFSDTTQISLFKQTWDEFLLFLPQWDGFEV